MASKMDSFVSFVERFGGVTTYFGIYTNAEYVTASTLAKELGFRLLAIILLYFNLQTTNPTDAKGNHTAIVSMFVNGKYYTTAHKVVGWAGLVYATLSIFDAALRPKFGALRIFDEASIVSLFCAMFAIFFTMFEKDCIAFLVLLGVAALAGIVVCIIMNWSLRPAGPPKPHKDLVRVLAALTKEAGENPDTLLKLRCLVFVLMALDAEDAHTRALLEIIKEPTDAGA